MRVGIVGFGMMGRQIAQVFAQNGHQVVATDEATHLLPSGLEEIENGPYGVQAAVTREKLAAEEATKVMARLQTTPSLKQTCKDSDLVIEAVFEDLALKQRLFQLVESAAPPNALLASNTSTLSIKKISSQITRKDRVLGLHFFNPAQVTKLVEIIRSSDTSSDAVERAVGIVKQLGKTPIVARDEPGFIANRLGLSLYIEASKVLEEGIASVHDIDTAMRLGFGNPMGPFEVADLVGLDTRLRNLESLYQSTGDPRWIPPKSLREMVNQGYLGDASKKKGSKGGYREYLQVNR